LKVQELGQKLAVGKMCAMAHKSVGLATRGVSDTQGTPPGTPERDKVLEDALKGQPDKEQARKSATLALSGLDQQLHRK